MSLGGLCFGILIIMLVFFMSQHILFIGWVTVGTLLSTLRFKGLLCEHLEVHGSHTVEAWLGEF